MGSTVRSARSPRSGSSSPGSTVNSGRSSVTWRTLKGWRPLPIEGTNRRPESFAKEASAPFGKGTTPPLHPRPAPAELEGLTPLATLTDKLWQGGALVSIKVMQTQSQVEALKDAGLPFATPTVIIGLIDTGASRTVIESRIIKS